MPPKKECFCCDNKVKKPTAVHEHQTNKIVHKEVKVSLVRVEDDPELSQNLIDDITSDYKTIVLSCADSSKKKQSVQKTLSIKLREQRPKAFKNRQSTRRLGKGSTTNVNTSITSLSSHFQKVDDSISNSKAKTSESYFMCDSSDMASRDKSKPGEELAIEGKSSVGKKSENRITKKQAYNSAGTQKAVKRKLAFKNKKSPTKRVKKTKVSIKKTVKVSENHVVSADIKEPLNLISKLTGFHVPPSKVEVLPLQTPCISSSSVQPKNDEHSIKSEELVQPKNESGEMCEQLVSYENSEQCNSEVDYSESLLERVGNYCRKVENKNLRTIYDVSNDMTTILPSWNLHILPDTNTFCIGQVTRNRSGIPHLSKCIELDDNFNAKVYVYQQHCKKYDGVYNNEEAVVALINDVDGIL